VIYVRLKHELQPALSSIPPFRHDPQRGILPQNAGSESALSMTSQVRRFNLDEFSRPTNKRTPAHFPDDAAQRSKRNQSGGVETLSYVWDNRSPASGLRNTFGQGDPRQTGYSWNDPRSASGQRLSSPQGLADLSSRNGHRSSFYSSYGQRNSSAQAVGVHDGQSWGSAPSSPVNTYNEQDGGILLQPETRPITQEQLVNEVKGVSFNSGVLKAQSNLNTPFSKFM
jgi:hypothetical protein